ncbi:hypothetical protein QYS60_02500 [Rhodococcus sp. GXMU-t2271]|uniref:Uncharacterized protein n=1 Tax=Rhodococcus indonesiensis TaxID=3055869 RepID=A0ABT7RUZ8_9NOCA|nr:MULTISPECIES: hypothetical protein [Rhodococcus]MDM7491479.1 hypothetical protein [Rhodococcus indonesiensis]
MPVGQKWCEAENEFFPAEEFRGDVHMHCQGRAWGIPDSYVMPSKSAEEAD